MILLLLCFLQITAVSFNQITLQSLNCPNITQNSYSARFIIVKSSFSNTLNFSQIACYDINGFNVVFGKSVIASSKANDQIDPNIITDGNKYARSNPLVYIGAENISSNIEINLDKDYAIYKCVIYNRADCCQDKIINSTVDLLNSSRVVLTSTVITNSSNEIQVLFPNLHRYIHLKASTSGDDHHLQVSQLACYDRADNNVALHKPVWASSLYFDGGNNPAVVTDGE